MTASPDPHVGMPSAEAIEAEILPMSYEGADLTECVDRILSLIRPAFEAQQAKLAQAVKALEPLAKLPLGPEIIENTEWVLYKNAGQAITVGDVLAARAAASDIRGEKT